MQLRTILALLLFLAAFISFDIYAEPLFQSSISGIPYSTQQIMQEYTWRPGCPVSLNDLAEVKLTYWGFDNKAHLGELIVNQAVANDVVNIFKDLYLQHFPIQSMRTMDMFKGDEMASLAANNTSAFNCRSMLGKPSVFSKHSYGLAIDINPKINPYVKGNQILPPSGKKFIDRNKPYTGKITKNSFIYREFIKYGWHWGGDWKHLKDYQHFEKRGYGTN